MNGGEMNIFLCQTPVLIVGYNIENKLEIDQKLDQQKFPDKPSHMAPKWL